jgi:hypothetical protein
LIVSRVALKVPSFIEVLGSFVKRLTITDTTLAEFHSSTTFLAMAALMLDPYPTLSGVQVPIFTLMLQITTEFGWGLIFLVIGGAQSIVNITRYQYGRKVAAFFSAVLWGLLFALGWMASPPSFFVPVCGTACLVQCLVYLRLGLLQEAVRRA